jgi:hypothetical protein
LTTQTVSQNNITLFTGDGPVNINFGILQDTLPMSLVGVSDIIIALKGGNDQPDPPITALNVFAFSQGEIVLTNAGSGLGTWTLPAAFLAEPAIYWWHGTIVVQGAVFTWGFGNLTVAAV